MTLRNICLLLGFLTLSAAPSRADERVETQLPSVSDQMLSESEMGTGPESVGFGWLFVNPAVVVTPFRVTAQVVNTWALPVVCRGQVFGTLTTGFVMNSWVGPSWVAPGAFLFATVAATPAFPFVNGWGEFYCSAP